MSDNDKYKDLNLIIIPNSECTCVDVAPESYDNIIILGYDPEPIVKAII